MDKKLFKNIFLGAFVAFIVVAVLTFIPDFHKVFSSISSFTFTTLTFIFFIFITVLLLKFIRWHYYIKLLDFPIHLTDSFLYFMSGQIMSISPGRWGEVIKSYFIKMNYNIKISESMPIVFAERVTEFIGLIIVGGVGIFIYNQSAVSVIILAAFLVFLIIAAKNKSIQKFVLSLLSNIPYVNKYVNSLNIMFDNSGELFSSKPLAAMILLSIVTWIFESFGFYIILVNFINNISVFWATFNYALSILFGAISMLPGGIGVTEGSLTYLLTAKGFSLEDAAAAIILIRFFTLWMSVIIGMLSLGYLLKNNNIKLSELLIKNGTNTE